MEAENKDVRVHLKNSYLSENSGDVMIVFFIYVSGLGNVPRRNNYAFDCLVWTWHENTLWKSSTPWLALEEKLLSAIAASSAFVWPRISLALYEKKRTITHQRKDKKPLVNKRT